MNGRRLTVVVGLVGVLVSIPSGAAGDVDLREQPAVVVIGDRQFRGPLFLHALGDVNGDGHEDVAAREGELFVEHRIRVVLGPFPEEGVIDLENGEQPGFTVAGVDPDEGLHVSEAGDVNGDGVDDMIIGSPEADNNGGGSGSAYVVFGSESHTDLELADFDSGTQGETGFRIDGVAFGHSGRTVASLGDVNGDGLSDVLVGAPFAETAVVFGKADPEPVLTEEFRDGEGGGFLIAHPLPWRSSSYEATPAGDFNGDGVTDVLISLFRKRSMPGMAWVVFGKDDAALVDLRDLGDGGVRVLGSGGRFGEVATTIGDFDGAGCDDIAIGAPVQGLTYIVFGCHPWERIRVDALGNHGMSVKSFPEGVALMALSGGTDVNGDGLDELAIGDINSDPFDRDGAGSVYIVLGGKKLRSLRAYKNTTRVIHVDGDGCGRDESRCIGDGLGIQVDLTRDVDGDGLGDLICGAWEEEQGKAYIVWSSLMNSG